MVTDKAIWKEEETDGMKIEASAIMKVDTYEAGHNINVKN